MKKTILIFLVFITLWSCQQDDFLREQNISTQEMSDFELKKISFSSLKTNKNVLQKIEKLNSLKKISSGSNHRTIYNDQYGVFIDTTHIMMISEGNKHTITFKIVSEENDKEFENLILNSKEDGGYFAYIAKYELTEEESIRIKNGENVNIFPISIIDIEDIDNQENNNQTNSIGVSGPCITESYWAHICTNSTGESTVIGYSGQGQNSPSGGECANGTLSYVQVQVITIDIGCVSGGGGGFGGGGSGGGENTGGTNPGNGSNPTNPGNGNTNPNNPQQPGLGFVDGDGNPIKTTPILTIDPEKTHISTLNKITNNNPTIRTYINNFRDGVSNPLIEEGIEFNSNNSPFPAQNNVYNGVRFFPVSMNNPVTRAHKHHNNLHPVFSAEDILGMVDFFTEKQAFDSNNAGNITFLMVSKTGVHAFRVSNIAEAQEFSGIYPTNAGKEVFKAAYKNRVIVKSSVECNCTSGTTFDNLLFTNFIQFFKDFV